MACSRPVLLWFEMNGSRKSPDSSPPMVLVVSFEQFGYHIDTFEYCRHLRERYRTAYLCIDHGLPRKELPGVDVLYCGRRPFGKVEVGLLLDSSAAIRRFTPNIVFLRRTKFSFLLGLRHLRTPMIFDVRSGSVEADAQRRVVENAVLWFNARFFRHITVISEGLAQQLRLPRRARVLPLAANPPPRLTRAPRDGLRLVSVGTFKNRHLERTVEGLGRFLVAAGSGVQVRYTIVGFGSSAERHAIEKAVIDHDLVGTVEVRDRLDHEAVPALLAEHNVGVAFTPQVPWFEYQPSTKIYEYLHSGLLCVATDSAANRAVVNDANGVLFDDTPEAFALALRRIVELLPRWRPSAVAEGVQNFTWEHVVADTLVPLLEGARR